MFTFTNDTACNYDTLFMHSIVNEKIDNKLYQILYNISTNNNKYYDNLLILFNEYNIKYLDIKNLDELNKNLDIIKKKIYIANFYNNEIDYYKKLYSFLNTKSIVKNIYNILVTDILTNYTISSIILINDIFDIKYTYHICKLINTYLNEYLIDKKIIIINNLNNLNITNNFYDILLNYSILNLQNQIINTYDLDKLILENRKYWKWLNINIDKALILKEEHYIKFNYNKYYINKELINNYDLLYDLLEYKEFGINIYHNNNKIIKTYNNYLLTIKDYIILIIQKNLQNKLYIKNIVNNIHKIILSKEKLYNTNIHKIIYIASIIYINTILNDYKKFNNIYAKKLLERLIYYDSININLRTIEHNVIKIFTIKPSKVPNKFLSDIYKMIHDKNIIQFKNNTLCYYQKNLWFDYFKSDNIINIKNTNLYYHNNNKKIFNIDGEYGCIDITLNLNNKKTNILFTPIQYLIVAKIMIQSIDIEKTLEKELNVGNNIINLIKSNINYLLENKIIIFDNKYKINMDIFNNSSYNLLKIKN